MTSTILSTPSPQSAAPAAAATPRPGAQPAPGSDLASAGIPQTAFAGLLVLADAASATAQPSAPVSLMMAGVEPSTESLQPAVDYSHLAMVFQGDTAPAETADPSGAPSLAEDLEVTAEPGASLETPAEAAMLPAFPVAIQPNEDLATAVADAPMSDVATDAEGAPSRPGAADEMATGSVIAASREHGNGMGTQSGPAAPIQQGAAAEGTAIPLPGTTLAGASLAIPEITPGVRAEAGAVEGRPVEPLAAKDAPSPAAQKPADPLIGDARAERNAAPEAAPAGKDESFESWLGDERDPSGSSTQAPGAHRAAAAALPAPASEGARAAPLQAVPIAGVALEIAARARAGDTRFEIRLDPPELGRIDVTLEIKADGRASTHLVVERAETLDLLLRDARSLERALGAAGLKADESPTFSLRDQSLKDQGSRDGHPGQREAASPFGVSGEEEASPADARRAMQILNAAARRLGARPLDLRV